MNSRILPLVLMGFGLAGIAADCQDCSQVAQTRRGNLDRAGDAVLVTGADGHAYAVVSNPELEHLRMLDLTTERFVDAPNLFFSASVATGPETRRLTTAPGDDSRVYALDAASDQVLVIRTVEKNKTSWVEAADPVPTGRAPADVAAFSSDSTVELWLSLPDERAVQVIGLDGVELARIILPEGSYPGDLIMDPLGESVVLADLELPVVHVFNRASRTFDRDLEVGGPINDLSAGVVDIGDGLAPVVLALRRDRHVAVALRLFREGFREDRYAVLGSVELAALPMVGYVPDQRDSETVCCRELDDDVVDAGEATDAWAAVATADGKVTYIALAAQNGDGRLVRLVDNDLEPIGLDELTDDAWQPIVGDEDRQPTATLAATAAFGDPPFVPLLDADEQLVLTWQGALPLVAGLRGDLVGSAFNTTVDLEARGVRPGDTLVLSADDEPAGCDRVHDAPVVAVDGPFLTLLRSPEGITDEDERCLEAGGDIRMSVNVAAAFTVIDADGDFLGRLGLVGDGSPDTILALPGAELSIAPAAAGPPRETGSTLTLGIDRHIGVVDLDLSDAVSTLGAGGFGSAAFLPVAVVGADMEIPDNTTATTIRARRMIITTGSIESGGRNVLFACDDAETVPSLCTTFR